MRARIIGDVLDVTNIAIGGRVYLAVCIGGHDGLQLDFGRDKMVEFKLDARARFTQAFICLSAELRR